MTHQIDHIASDLEPVSAVAFEFWLGPWLDFFANITASLAWPIVVLVIALKYRTHIVATLNNLKSVRFGGAEATFDRDLQQATEKAKALEPSSSEIEQANQDRTNELVKMSATSPSGAIIEAWKDVEQAAREMVESSGLPLNNLPSRPYYSLQVFLSKNALLPKAEIETFRELRMIRNRAAHPSEHDVTVDQARRYVLLADRLVDAIKTLASA